MEKSVAFLERLFFMMVWVIIVLVLAGFLFHLLASRGIGTGILQWVGGQANLQAQAGG